MSRILFTSMPFAGHIRPGLPIARELVGAGHEVLWYTGQKYAALVAGSGATFVPYPESLDFDDADVDERRGTDGAPPAKPGLKDLRRDIQEVFLRPVAEHVDALEAVVRDFRPDVVATEHTFIAGALLAERRQIPLVVFAVTPLTLSSIDTAPFGTGLPPSSTWLGRLRNRALNAAMRQVIFRGAQQQAAQLRDSLGLPPLPGYFLDWTTTLADRFLVPSVPEFEYHRSDLPDSVQFVGVFLPAGADDGWTPPSWWDELAQAKSAGRWCWSPRAPSPPIRTTCSVPRSPRSPTRTCWSSPPPVARTRTRCYPSAIGRPRSGSNPSCRSPNCCRWSTSWSPTVGTAGCRWPWPTAFRWSAPAPPRTRWRSTPGLPTPAPGCR